MKNFFSSNVSKMSGTYQKHVWDLLNTFRGSESLWKAHFCIFWQTFAVFESKSTIFGFKIAPEAMQIEIPGAVLSVGVVGSRDYVRLKALMLENILNTHIMGVKPIENFLQVPELREATQIHNI